MHVLRRHLRILWYLPLIAVSLVALLGALGIGIASRASAASATSNVVVNATINANVAIDATTNCAAAARDIGAVSINALATTPLVANYCRVSFGASNTDRVQLAVVETGGLSATSFFERGGADATNRVADKAACGAMAGGTEEGGMRMAASSVGPTGNVTAWACAATSYRAVPKASINACIGLGSAPSTTAYTCDWIWAISMDGTPPLSGAYSGTVAFTASDYRRSSPVRWPARPRSRRAPMLRPSASCRHHTPPSRPAPTASTRSRSRTRPGVGSCCCRHPRWRRHSSAASPPAGASSSRIARRMHSS
jgi:hypothetical protein